MPSGIYKRLLGVNCGLPTQGFQKGHPNIYGFQQGNRTKSQYKKGHSLSKIVIEKLRKASKGNTNMLGKKQREDKYQTKEGRWLIWIDGKRMKHPRYIAEKCLGRKLTSKEIVHHINEDKSDDRPENLYVFPSRSEHTRHHGWKIKPILTSNI